jgi:hypothetical protein
MAQKDEDHEAARAANRQREAAREEEQSHPGQP